MIYCCHKLIKKNGGVNMDKKKVITISIIVVVLIVIAVCIAFVYSLKKDVETAQNEYNETVEQYGSVEKETVNNIVAKFNTEIMDGGLNTPASADYTVVENNTYWYALTDNISLYLKPVEFSGNKESDILDMSALYLEKDGYNEEIAIKYVKKLIKANNYNLTEDEIDNLVKEAKTLSSQKAMANNGKGISVGLAEADDHYEYQVVRLYK